MAGMTEEEMKKRLRFGVCVVTFTKANGDKRVMRCSTSPAYLPPQEIIEGAEKKVALNTPGLIRAYDLDIKAWRSFKVDSVMDFAGDQ